MVPSKVFDRILQYVDSKVAHMLNYYLGNNRERYFHVRGVSQSFRNHPKVKELYTFH